MTDNPGHQGVCDREDCYERMHRVIALEDALRDLINPSDCVYDHFGYCHAHLWLKPGVCPQKRAKELLGDE